MKHLIPIVWAFALLSIVSMVLLAIFKVDNTISAIVGISELVIIAIMIVLVLITPQGE